MAGRYAQQNSYEEDPVWSRDARPRSPMVYPGPQPHNGNFYGPQTAYPHTTMVHSSIKPVPDSDIYK